MSSKCRSTTKTTCLEFSDTKVFSFGSSFSKLLNYWIVPLFLLLVMPFFSIFLVSTVMSYNGNFQLLFADLSGKFSYHSLRMLINGSNFGTFSLSVIFCYSIFSLFLMRILPGKRFLGPISPNGHTPVYYDNGFLQYIITMVVFVLFQLYLQSRGLSVTIIYDRFFELLFTINILSIVFCGFLYLKGRFFPSGPDNGLSGSFIFDYYWGTELYPRIFGWDVKVFSNCRFGMMVWPLLVCVHALKSYELHGHVVDSMAVSAFLQLFYISKFFWWESGYMATLDIIFDRAGFYICWGCFVYVPSLYASVTFYLVSHPVLLGPTLSAVILLFGFFSIIVNYWTDYQKQIVRDTGGQCNIFGAPASFIRACHRSADGKERVSLLLTCGWWSLSRHFNYLAEISLALCWTLPAGFHCLYPYSYLIFLTILLVHRSFRDEDKCSRKYAAAWTEYRRAVPFRIVPFVF